MTCGPDLSMSHIFSHLFFLPTPPLSLGSTTPEASARRAWEGRSSGRSTTAREGRSRTLMVVGISSFVAPLPPIPAMAAQGRGAHCAPEQASRRPARGAANAAAGGRQRAAPRPSSRTDPGIERPFSRAGSGGPPADRRQRCGGLHLRPGASRGSSSAAGAEVTTRGSSTLKHVRRRRARARQVRRQRHEGVPPLTGRGRGRVRALSGRGARERRRRGGWGAGGGMNPFGRGRANYRAGEIGGAGGDLGPQL
jgi:hypothetical protein